MSNKQVINGGGKKAIRQPKDFSDCHCKSIRIIRIITMTIVIPDFFTDGVKVERVTEYKVLV